MYSKHALARASKSSSSESRSGPARISELEMAADDEPVGQQRSKLKAKHYQTMTLSRHYLAFGFSRFRIGHQYFPDGANIYIDIRTINVGFLKELLQLEIARVVVGGFHICALSL